MGSDIIEPRRAGGRAVLLPGELPAVLNDKRVSSLLRLSTAIDRAMQRLGGLLSALVLITVGVGFYNVVARYLGRLVGVSLASNRLIELQWYLFSLTFLLSFPHILQQGANVRVDVLEVRWSDRRRALIGFWGTVLFLLPFCLLGLWVTLNPVLQSWGLLPDGTWGTWEVSADANGLPRAPIKSMVLVSFGLLLMQGISQAIKYWAVWCGYAEGAVLPSQDDPSPLK